MLAVPLKATEKVDFVEPLSSYISDNYGEQVPEDVYVASLSALNDLREQCTTFDEAAQKTTDVATQEKQRQAMLLYYAQVCAMQTKFPISASSTSAKMSFTWKDAFKPSKKVKQHSLAYERASVLFNLGALYTMHGLNADGAGGDYARNAAKLFMQAAGVYSHLRDHVSPRVSGGLTSDLSQEGLSMIVELMQAQAQALYYAKCVETPAAKLTRGNEKKKSAICAKLAQRAMEIYKDAAKNLEVPSLAAVINKAWNAHITYQVHIFTAIAQYKQSEVDHEDAEEEGEGYGLELGRLSKANSECQAALDLASGKTLLTPTEKASATQLLEKIVSRYNERRLENEKIYMEAVTRPDDLPPVKSQTMAKIIVPLELMGADGSAGTIPKGRAGPETQFIDLFQSMVPAEALKANMRYQSQLADIVRDVEQEADAATKAVQEQLAKIGLPGAVEASEAGAQGVPDEVWAKVTEVRDIGGLGKLDIMCGSCRSQADEIEGVLRGIESELDNEEKQDREYRSRHGAKWTAVQSEQLTREMRMDHSNYAKLLREAAESDALVEQLLSANRNIIRQQLGESATSRGDLDARMPPVNPEVAAAVAPVRNDLVKLLKELNVLLKNRRYNVTALQRAAERDDLTKDLVRAGCGVPDEALEAGTKTSEQKERWSRDAEKTFFQVAAAKHNAKKNSVYASMEQQSRLFERIAALNMKFQQVKVDSVATREREQIINGINAAVLSFHDVHSKLKQGASFYGDLRSRCDQLRQTVSGHVHGRALQVS